MQNIKRPNRGLSVENKLFANLLTIMGMFFENNRESSLYQFNKTSILMLL